jgi:NhaA family Na+:H+ antiporter
MAVFFLVVGLEVKREFLRGELSDRRRATLPIVAAIGGMVVPAVLYLAFNVGGETQGWGIPVATDIAFALGVLALVAPGIPPAARAFLLALAIADDIGAIVIIAVAYSESIDGEWLAAAMVALGLVLAFRQLGLTFTPLFVLLGTAVWLALHEAGIHATLAGVAMGLAAPATPALSRAIARSRADELVDVFSPAAARETTRIARQSVPQLEWLEHMLHPWTSFMIVPLFALANAGIRLTGDAVADAAGSTVAIGVFVGLVVGKPFGIASAAWLASRTGLAALPEGVSWRQLIGVAALGGVGFTVSIFITALAFDDAALASEAKVGVFAASIAASLIGAGLLRASRQ